MNRRISAHVRAAYFPRHYGLHHILDRRCMLHHHCLSVPRPCLRLPEASHPETVCCHSAVATDWTNIDIRLIRAILAAPVFTIFSFVGVWSHRHTDYMYPIPALYEAFTFVSVFYLLIAA